MINNISKIIKHKFSKIFYVTVLICSLGWGISSIATDDISSAHKNFSASGIVSDISEESIVINQANGSDKSNNTSYSLNIKYLERVETSEYITLQLSNIKVGDKIIAQGLTNGSSFFIKRIISFSTDAKDIKEGAADGLVIASTTATTTVDVTSDVINSATQTQSSESVAVSVPVAPSTATTSDTLSDGDIATTTSSTTTEDIVSTSTTATTTADVVGDVVDTAQSIIDSITDVVNNIVETVVDVITGTTASTTPEVVDIKPEPKPESDTSSAPAEQIIDNNTSTTPSE